MGRPSPSSAQVALCKTSDGRAGLGPQIWAQRLHVRSVPRPFLVFSLGAAGRRCPSSSTHMAARPAVQNGFPGKARRGGWTEREERRGDKRQQHHGRQGWRHTISSWERGELESMRETNHMAPSPLRPSHSPPSSLFQHSPPRWRGQEVDNSAIVRRGEIIAVRAVCLRTATAA